MKISLLVLSYIFLFFTGCTNPLADQPHSVIGDDYHPGLPAPVSIQESEGFKVSPGSVRSSGQRISGRTTITISNQYVRGSAYSGKMSINQFK